MSVLPTLFSGFLAFPALPAVAQRFGTVLKARNGVRVSEGFKKKYFFIF